MELIFEFFRDFPRQGPGDNEYTRKAFNMIPSIPETPEILDVGCGSGVQTIELARISGGHVTGLDIYQPFLDRLQKNAEKAGLSEKITVVRGSMSEMPFDKDRFDIIWAEGSIFIIGFEKGLSEWKKFLRPGGHLVISELTWFKENPPKEAVDFFKEDVGAVINSVDENISLIKKCGYSLIGNFSLPESVWLNNFFKYYDKRIQEFKSIYPDNEEARKLCENASKEVDIYKKYSGWYGYEFFVMRNEK